MRNPSLHEALRAFSVDAARVLTRELEEGAELPFEVAEERGAVSPLYRYRPLTGRFIAARWPALRALATCAPAEDALGAGAAAYLRRLGARGADAEPALQAMLERLWEDLTSFAFPEERFERVYAELERALYAGALRVTVVAPVHGLVLEGPKADLGEGLVLVPAGSDAPSGLPGDVLLRLERVVEEDDEAPVDEATRRARALLSALRLLGASAAVVGPLAYSRVDDGPWQAASLGTPELARGEPWRLASTEVAEVRELLALLDAPGPPGAVRWAHGRFDMACERPRDVEALTDLLLALGALLEGGDELGRANLPLRVAALCAEEGARRGVQRRVELAFSLERLVQAGGWGDAYVEVIGSESPRRLVAEVEEHVRGLLRDVLCGYLEPDLVRAADDVLLRSSEPLDIRAHDTRPSAAGPAFGPDPAAAEPPPAATAAAEALDLDLDLEAPGADDDADLGLDLDPEEPEPPQADVVPAADEALVGDGEPPAGDSGTTRLMPAPEPEPSPARDRGPVPARAPAPPVSPAAEPDRGWVATAGLHRPPRAESLADWDFDP